ncbi:MAG: hypothetical protein IPN42_09870 [Methylococcaceae bacterium]|nr:hypothetical protein [Methylococcaceae bacterium]
MKKFYIALLFAFSSLSMQTASAATLTLGNFIGGSVVSASGSAVSGTATGAPTSFFGLPISSWSLTVSDTATVDFALTGTTSFISIVAGNGSVLDFNTSSFSALLTTGTYLFAILSSAANQPYSLTISTISSVVPVPAAVWLFGSAFLGMIGLVRRKSQPGLAA